MNLDSRIVSCIIESIPQRLFIATTVKTGLQQGQESSPQDVDGMLGGSVSIQSDED
ncbi:MAG: hypothetical protein ACHQ1H_02140 [Nitrososphaerales archaeon]